MDQNTYIIAKEMFLNGKSLRQIGEELNINRKKLSLMLRKEDVYTDKKISEDTLNEAIALINSGKKVMYVATILNVDRHTLSKELKNKGIRTPQKRHARNKKYDDLIVCKYIDENKSIESIAIELGVSTNLVWNCLLEKRLNESNRLNKKYNYNEDLFLSIRTEHEAYWLGFLYADGYVNVYETAIELCLQKRDEEHVKKFRDYVSDCKTYDKEVDGHIQHRVDIYNKQLAQNLINCGCANNKTFILKFPTEIVPEELMRHFIRGYFDGDGCISGLHFSILGASYSFIECIQNYLVDNLSIKKNKISTLLPRKENYSKMSKFDNAAKADIKKLFDYLYKDSTIYLERKYDKFNSINKFICELPS